MTVEHTSVEIQVAPSDYMKVLLRYVDIENIPEYLGGALRLRWGHLFSCWRQAL
jgi:hypothetical protein